MSISTRPVIPGFNPDPSICRVGDDHYLVCSSFEYAPGVPVYHSTDLRDWRLIGHALDRPSQLPLGDAGASGGVYAPTIRHHEGRFWLVTTNVGAGGGHLLVTSDEAAGPWSEPVSIPDAVGIDPDLAWDEAGTCFLTWSGLNASGDHAIVQAQLDPATGELLSEPAWIWTGTGGRFPEAPHLYRIDGWWYLLVAEGGTERAHAATVARSRTPDGPFTASPLPPLVTARGTDSVVQSTGHADLVQRPDGTWAMVFLGVRARGMTPEWHVLGRETFAAEVHWSDGWPIRGAAIEPSVATAVDERADGSTIPPDWCAPGRLPTEFVRPTAEGFEITAGSAERSFVGRRQQHLTFAARAAVDASSGTGGIELRIDDRHAVTVTLGGGTARVVAHVGDLVAVLGEVPADGEEVLEVRATDFESVPERLRTRRGPDQIVASIIGPDGPVELGRLDGRYLSTEVAGGFTGRFVGLVCSEGSVLVRSFEYTGP